MYCSSEVYLSKRTFPPKVKSSNDCKYTTFQKFVKLGFLKKIGVILRMKTKLQIQILNNLGGNEF